MAHPGQAMLNAVLLADATEVLDRDAAVSPSVGELEPLSVKMMWILWATRMTILRRNSAANAFVFLTNNRAYAYLLVLSMATKS